MGIFVTRCREHYEALTAVDLLKQDLQDWEAAGMPVSLAQIKELPSFNKLSAYTNLFKRQALDNFLSLADDRITRDDPQRHDRRHQPSVQIFDRRYPRRCMWYRPAS